MHRRSRRAGADLGCGKSQRAASRKPACGARLQPRSVSLPGAEAAADEPAESRPLGGNRLIGDRASGKADPAACVAQTIEKVFVLAAAAPELGPEAQAFARDHRAPDQDVARVPGLDPSTDENGPRRVEIAGAHPGRRRFWIDRLNRTENRVPLSACRLAKKSAQPDRRCDLVVIQEREPLGGGRIEARVAGDRDVARRRMDINRIEIELARGRLDQLARRGIAGIVGDDHADARRRHILADAIAIATLRRSPGR